MAFYHSKEVSFLNFSPREPDIDTLEVNFYDQRF